MQRIDFELFPKSNNYKPIYFSFVVENHQQLKETFLKTLVEYDLETFNKITEISFEWESAGKISVDFKINGSYHVMYIDRLYLEFPRIPDVSLESFLTHPCKQIREIGKHVPLS